MTLQGTVVNGNIVFDEPAQLPEGARVEGLPGDITENSVLTRSFAPI